MFFCFFTEKKACKKRKKSKSKPCCPPAPRPKCPRKKKPKCPPPCPSKPKSCAPGGEKDDMQLTKPSRRGSSKAKQQDLESINSNSSVEDNLLDDLPPGSQETGGSQRKSNEKSLESMEQME